MERPKKNEAENAATENLDQAEVLEKTIEVQEPPEGVPAEGVLEQKTGGATGERLFSEAETKEMIAKAVAEAMAQIKAQQAPQIIQVATDSEKVHFLFQAEVSDENGYEIGPQGMYGRVVGKTGSFFVPKSDLSRVMDAMFRLMLERRWIIAVDGLTDEERDAYNVNYREGELLDKRGFARMVELGDGMLSVYPKLCAGHREMVAKRYHEAYANKSPYVTREIVVELNRLSKQLGGGDGDFKDIIEAMNAADLG